MSTKRYIVLSVLGLAENERKKEVCARFFFSILNINGAEGGGLVTCFIFYLLVEYKRILLYFILWSCHQRHCLDLRLINSPSLPTDLMKNFSFNYVPAHITLQKHLSIVLEEFLWRCHRWLVIVEGCFNVWL